MALNEIEGVCAPDDARPGRLRQVLHARRDLPACELVERCFDELARFGGGGPASDDQTPVLVQRSR